MSELMAQVVKTAKGVFELHRRLDNSWTALNLVTGWVHEFGEDESKPFTTEQEVRDWLGTHQE